MITAVITCTTKDKKLYLWGEIGDKYYVKLKNVTY
jgi:hypothetical protein